MFEKKKPANQPLPMLAIIAGVAVMGLVLLCGVGGLAGWLLLGRTSTGNAPIVQMARTALPK